MPAFAFCILPELCLRLHGAHLIDGCGLGGMDSVGGEADSAARSTGVVQKIGDRLVVYDRCIELHVGIIEEFLAIRPECIVVVSLSIHRFLGTISPLALRSLYDPSTDGYTNAISKSEFP